MRKIKRFLSVMLAASIGLGMMAIPATAQGESKEEISSANIALSREIATEGMVLLKNDNASLPLEKGENVAIFGGGQINFIKGGTGSGDVSAAYVRNLLQGMQEKEKEGKIAINTDISAKYTANTNYVPTAADLNAAAAKSDTAIVIFTRNSGETSDRKAIKGDYYLSDAETNLLKQVCGAGFESVSVVLNIGGVMDTSWIEAYPQIDSVLLAWQPGMEGGLAVADILVGDVNPSGKLVDTFAASFDDYPSSENFGANWDYEAYTEDIYVGYRWFETFDPDYEKVNYEFGYGLSYTNFRMSGYEVKDDGENITVSVDVKNTGSVAGKEVVQVYFSAPQGKLGKPGKELAAFAKTDLLAPGESQTLKMTFAIADMASYDDTGKIQESAYILEAGTYNIYIGNSIKDAGLRGVKGKYEVTQDTIAEQLTEQGAPIQLEKRLLADGSYETLDTIYNTDVDYGNKVVDDGVTKVEAEDSSFRHQYAPVWFNENDTSICVLDVKSQGDGNRFASFDLDVEAAGVYDFVIAATNKNASLTNSIRLYVNEVLVTNGGSIDLTTTGSSDAEFWNIREYGTMQVTLPAGKCSLRVEFANGGSYRGVFDYFTLTPSGKTYTLDEEKEAPVPETDNGSGNIGISFLDVYEGKSSMNAFLKQMSNEELADLLHGKGTTLPYGNTGLIGNMADYGIPVAETADGPAGVRFNAGATDIDGGATISTTAWPIATLVACTWNTELVEKMGEAFGKEAAAYKIDILLAPGMNIHRNPLCGRNFEYYSEDPLVTGKIAAALVRGIQSQKVAVTVKHFAANNREYYRKNMDSRMSERALREIYLEGFRIAVEEGGAWGVMSSYNRVNGTAVAESVDLLTGILRDEWGFDGAVLSDWRNTATSYKEIIAGGDVKMPWDEGSKVLNQVDGALDNGLITRADLLTSAERTLNLIMRTGAVDRMLENQITHTISATGTSRVKAVESSWKSSGVGSQTCSDVDGGNNPTYTQDGAWTRYDLSVEDAGTYIVRSRIASPRTGATIEFSMNGELLGTVVNNVGSTDWQDWRDAAEFKVQLPAGDVTLQLDFPGSAVNINWFEFEKVATTEEITIIPIEGMVAPGETVQLEASGEVNWAVKGNLSANTTIDAQGNLTVGADEEALQVYVYATSTTDTDAVDIITVTIGVEAVVPPTPELLMGDVDESGVVDVADIMKAKDLIMTGEWNDDQLAVGDISGNGAIDVADIMGLKNIIMSN